MCRAQIVLVLHTFIFISETWMTLGYRLKHMDDLDILSRVFDASGWISIKECQQKCELNDVKPEGQLQCRLVIFAVENFPDPCWS